MLRFSLLVALVASAAARGTGAQVAAVPQWLGMDAPALSAAVGSESDAAQVVAQAIAQFLALPPAAASVTVAASQIPAAWLPTIPDVRFVRLDDKAIVAHHDRCRPVMWVRMGRVENSLVVTVAAGTKCRTRGLEYRFRRVAERWQRDSSGVGGGFASQGSDCGCP